MNQNISKINIITQNRSFQDFEPYQEYLAQKSFKHLFAHKHVVILEYNTEIQLLDSYSILTQIIDLFYQEVFALYQKSLKKNQKIVLKYTSTGKEQYVVLGFMCEKKGVFGKPLQTNPSTPLTPRLVFRQMSVDQAEEYLFSQRRIWREKFQTDEQIGQCAKKKLKDSIKILFKTNPQEDLSQLYSTLFTQLHKAFGSDQDRTTIEHLKQVWGIPEYVCSDEPEQAVAFRARLQRVYTASSREILDVCTQFFLNTAIPSFLRSPITPLESTFFDHLYAPPSSLSDHNSDLNAVTPQEINQLYQEVLDGTSIPEETSLLFGHELYLEKLTQFFSHLTSTDASEYSEWYRLKDQILENIILSLEPFSRNVNASGEAFFQAFAKLIIKRIRVCITQKHIITQIRKSIL